MSHFLVAQATYHHIEVGLYEHTTSKQCSVIPKHDASSSLIIEIQKILQNHHLTYKDLLFIGANQGPAPFTTLRVLIATLNGITFASKTPLVGIDGLKTFYQEVESPTYPQTVILLNAYNQDAYYAYKQNNAIMTGWKNISIFLKDINNLMPTNTIRFIGNGISFFNQEIINIFGERAFFPEPMIDHPSLDTLAHEALQQFEAGKIVQQIKPLYLKKTL